MNRFHQPVGFFGRFGDVHAEVEVFRSCPGRQYRSKLLLDLVFRNFTADECSDAVSAFEIIFIHQSADRLTERHVTDAEFVRHNPFRRQKRAARIVADPYFPENSFPDMLYFIWTHAYNIPSADGKCKSLTGDKGNERCESGT